MKFVFQVDILGIYIFNETDFIEQKLIYKIKGYSTGIKLKQRNILKGFLWQIQNPLNICTIWNSIEQSI